MFLDILNICVCVFILLATTQMFLITRRHARQNAALIAQLKFNHRIQHGRVFKPQEAAATKMVGVVVAVFLSCYLLDTYDTVCHLAGSVFLSCYSLFVLHHVLNMAGLYAQRDIRRMVLSLLRLLNSAVNLVAYALLEREIRKELR